MSIITENGWFNHIPFTEYRPDIDVEIQGTFFFVHGHTCSKEPKYLGNLPLIFTRLGYLFVAIDAYRHGERKSEPYLLGNEIDKALAMPEVIEHTCSDLQYLYDNKYSKISGKL